MTEEEKARYIAQLETLGTTQVRSDLEHGGISPELTFLTIHWLSQKEREAESRREASSSAQIELARLAAAEASRASAAAERSAGAAERQAKAAETANTRATIALAIAIISIIFTIISIWITHMDASK